MDWAGLVFSTDFINEGLTRFLTTHRTVKSALILTCLVKFLEYNGYLTNLIP